MKIKCKQCKAQIDKKSQYCQYCGFEMTSSKTINENSEEFKQNPTNKTAFVTNGDIFEIRNEVAVLGIAVQEIKVGDVLTFDNYELVINRIELLGPKSVVSVQKGNCVLYFSKLNAKEFKKNILNACEKFSSTNQPIYFTSKPTTKYVFLDLKERL